MGTGGPSPLKTLTAASKFQRNSLRIFCMKLSQPRLLVHLQGFEPGTHWLRVSCSTNWAKGAFTFGYIPFGFKALLCLENRIKHIWMIAHFCSSPRTISISQLNALLHLHLWPIKLVVFKCPYQLNIVGYLILRCVSRLDAFSVYHIHTRLPGCAPGGTTDAPAVCPSRSSRTKDSSSQISCAHDR